MSYVVGPENFSPQSVEAARTIEYGPHEQLLQPGVKEALDEARHERHEHSRRVRAWRWARVHLRH